MWYEERTKRRSVFSIVRGKVWNKHAAEMVAWGQSYIASEVMHIMFVFFIVRSMDSLLRVSGRAVI